MALQQVLQDIDLETLVNIIKEKYGNKPFYVSELARKTGIPKEVIRRRVYRLLKMGVIEVVFKKGRGGMRLYRLANPSRLV